MLRLAIILGGYVLLAAASCDDAQKKTSVDCGKTQGRGASENSAPLESENSANSAPSESATPCDSPVETPSDCANTPLERCLSNEKCRILSAHRFDTTRGCRFPAEQVACAPAVFECDTALTYVKDPNATKWLFYNGCVPEGKGWETFQPSVAELGAADGPLCD